MPSVLRTMFALAITLCPPAFRREYGVAMREDFAQAIASEHTLHGWFGAVAYGFGAIADLITTALREYAAMFFRDFAYAFRALRKTPSFTAIVVLTLALAIGANAAVFSILRTVVLDPLPYAQPNELVTLTPIQQPNVFSLPDFARIARARPQLDDAAAFTTSSGTLSRHGARERLQGILTTPKLFRTLGVTPILGRFADARDVARGAAKSIVISEKLYRRAFGANPSAIGSVVWLDDDVYRLIGVAPSSFAQPLPGRGLYDSFDYWTFVPEDGLGTTYDADNHSFFAIARLAPQASAGVAQAAIATVVNRMRARDPVHDKDLAVRVDSLTDSLVGSVRPLFLALFAAVVAVLLVACANVANLLLSRAASRDREFSVRVALGASRGRIIVQLLTETFVLASAGGVIGLGLAYGVATAFVASNPPNVPRANLVSVDGYAIAYTFGVVAFCTLAAGLAPAYTMAHREVAVALKSAGRGGSAHRGGRARSILVSAEIAMTLALVVAAGLVLRSFVTLTTQPLGFDPSGVSIVGIVDLSDRRYASAAAEESFLNQVLERARRIRGVTDAAWGLGVPFGHGLFSTSIAADGHKFDPRTDENVQISTVSPAYFSTMRVRLRSGRAFSENDRANGPPVAIVNESFARRYLAGRSAIGAYVLPAMSLSGTNPPRRRIVGVVADQRWKLTAAIEPVIYLPVRQLPMSFFDLVVRAAPGSDAGKAAAAAIVATDPLMPMPAVVTMDASIASNVAVQRLTVTALCALAFVALALSIAGVFGVVSYGVTQRTHEFGVRMALGANARGIVAMVVAGAMRLALFGIVCGLLVAGAGTRLLADELFETQPLDPLTFGCVTALVLIAAFAAALVPARRATRVDPIVALRYE